MSSLLRAKRLLWAIIFGLVTVMASLSYVSGRRYARAERWVEHTLEVQGTIGKVLAAVMDSQDASRGFLLTHEPELLIAARAARRTAPALLAHLAELTSDNASQQRRIVELRLAIADKLAFIDQLVNLTQAGEEPRAIALIVSGRGIVLMNHVRDLAAAMDAEELRLLGLRKVEAQHAQVAALWGVGVGSVLTIAMSLVSFVTVHTDVEELRRTTEELVSSEEHFRLVTESSRDLVRVADGNSKVLYVSPSVERILGYTPEEFITFPALSLVHPEDAPLFQTPPGAAPLHERLQGVQLEYRIRHKDGDYRWLEINFSPLRDGLGRMTGIQSSARDVTERHVVQERLAAQALELRSLSLRDELTGLYNRRGWLELSRQGLRLAQREKRAAAVIFVDLNGMKLINDQLGHEEGDHALKDTASLLKKACREVDVIARFGGDEFVVFGLDIDDSGLEVLRRRLQAATEELNTSDGRLFQLSMSVGAAFFQPETPETIDELLERADEQMYEQKRARKLLKSVAPKALA